MYAVMLLGALWFYLTQVVMTGRLVVCLDLQVQYGCAVIQLLMSRLDDNTDTSTAVKTCIVGVLSEIVHITAEDSIGTNCSLLAASQRLFSLLLLPANLAW